MIRTQPLHFAARAASRGLRDPLGQRDLGWTTDKRGLLHFRYITRAGAAGDGRYRAGQVSAGPMALSIAAKRAAQTEQKGRKVEDIQIGSSDLRVARMGVGVMPWSDSAGFGYGSRLGLNEAPPKVN